MMRLYCQVHGRSMVLLTSQLRQIYELEWPRWILWNSKWQSACRRAAYTLNLEVNLLKFYKSLVHPHVSLPMVCGWRSLFWSQRYQSRPRNVVTVSGRILFSFCCHGFVILKYVETRGVHLKQENFIKCNRTLLLPQPWISNYSLHLYLYTLFCAWYWSLFKIQNFTRLSHKRIYCCVCIVVYLQHK